MSKKAVLSVCFILTFAFYAASQEIVFGNFEIKTRYLKGDYKNTKIANEIGGTPFLDEKYKLGYLYFEGKNPVLVHMRYNIVNETIEVRIDDETFAVQDDIDIKLDEVNWVKLKYEVRDPQYLSPGYFKVLTKNYEEDDLILLEKPLKFLKEGQKPAAMKTMTQGRYLDRADLYFKFPDSKSPVFIESKLKKFLTLFPLSSQEKIADYIQNNNLGLKTQQDLERVVGFYNTL